MTVEELARSAGATTRAAVAAEADADAALATFHARRRRRSATRVGAVAATLTVVVLVVLLVAPWSTPQAEPPPATQDGWCGVDPAVQCLPGSVVEVDALTPYRFEVPPGFGRVVMLGRDGNTVDAYQRVPGVRAGVTFVVGAWPVGARGERLDARRMARWVASRPFLETTAPVRVQVGGHTAWQVEVVLRGTTRGPLHRCNQWQPSCRPLLEQDDELHGIWQTGPWRGMVSRYRFVDALSGPVVIWSWAFDQDRRALARNDALVATFRIRP